MFVTHQIIAVDTRQPENSMVQVFALTVNRLHTLLTEEHIALIALVLDGLNATPFAGLDGW